MAEIVVPNPAGTESVMRTLVTGPRFRDLKTPVIRAAHRSGLDYRTLEESRGIFRKSLYFEVSGGEKQIQDFMDRVGMVIDGGLP